VAGRGACLREADQRREPTGGEHHAPVPRAPVIARVIVPGIDRQIDLRIGRRIEAARW
jgi:hypothetical protein